MFHADSLFEGGLYGEAKQTYDLAFSEDRYILPYHLSEVARKMIGIRNNEAAQDYLNHRVKMEKDFYEEPSATVGSSTQWRPAPSDDCSAERPH